MFDIFAFEIIPMMTQPLQLMILSFIFDQVENLIHLTTFK